MNMDRQIERKMRLLWEVQEPERRPPGRGGETGGARRMAKKRKKIEK
ncbi:MAG: hypothetical protein ACRD3T_04555 [Terriglobia bacterium]